MDNRIEMWQKAVLKHNEIELGKKREEEEKRQKFAAFLADKYASQPPLEGNVYLNNLIINLFMVMDNSERLMMMTVLKGKNGLALIEAIDRAPKDENLLRNVRRELYERHTEHEKQMTMSRDQLNNSRQ